MYGYIEFVNNFEQQISGSNQNHHNIFIQISKFIKSLNESRNINTYVHLITDIKYSYEKTIAQMFMEFIN